MKLKKASYLAFLVLLSLGLASCSRNLANYNGGGGGNGSGGGGNGGSGGGGGTPTGNFTIGGKVTGLLGIGLVLQDNGGDDLAITANGNFSFKTPVSGAYAVTVKTQPTSPVQSCLVTNGSGTATANVTTVQINCGGGGLTISGSVSGLIGSGLVLQLALTGSTSGNESYPINGYGNVPFTFATQVTATTGYTVTVQTQPTNPTQTCSVVNGTGTISGNVNNVQVICTQPGFTVGGSTVGLVVAAPPADTLELQNNAGDDLFVSGDGTWKFPTPLTNGGIYNVSMFLPPSSQPQPCNLFFQTGIATGNVADVLVDCQHNDWGWTSWFISTTSAANNYSSITTPLIPVNGIMAADLGTPGGRDFAASWTDKFGRQWLFGGFGYPLPSPLGRQLPGYLNDLWVYSPGWLPANIRTYTDKAGDVLIDPAVLENEDSPTGSTPGSRWGSSSWTDTSGNLYLFGGQGFDSTGGLDPKLLSDMWKCTPAASFDGAPFGPSGGTVACPWTFVGGSTVGNTTGTYPASVGGTGTPGGRWAALTATDAAGNFYLFGGQGLDSSGKIGLLNDLWKYSPTANTWTWLGPSNSNVVTQNSTATAPGSRQAGVMWVDSSTNIWLFGGFGLDSAGTTGSTGPNGAAGAILNDLWEFSGGQWTQKSGGNLANQTGTYGTQSIANIFPAGPYPAGNTPGSRWGAVGWKDTNNNLWIYGGWGYGSVSTDPTGFLNDIWEYQASSGNWVWWKGTSNVNQNTTIATAATDGVLFVRNVVGGRRGAALWAPDAFGYVMVFGGEGYDITQGAPPGYLNDLWTYLPFP